MEQRNCSGLGVLGFYFNKQAKGVGGVSVGLGGSIGKAVGIRPQEKNRTAGGRGAWGGGRQEDE